jgi:hypothetical protein
MIALLEALEKSKKPLDRVSGLYGFLYGVEKGRADAGRDLGRCPRRRPETRRRGGPHLDPDPA